MGEDTKLEMPADKFVELALLGAYLLDPPLMDELDGVEPQHFYYPIHARVYRKMRKFWDDGEPLDVAMLSGDDVEVRTTLLDAQSECASSRLAPHYAKQVFELAEKRRLVAVAEDLAHAAMNGSSSEEVLAWVTEELGKTQNRGGNLYERWESQLVSGADMAELGPIEREYLVADFLRAGSVSVFYGKPGEFKSGLLMDLCQCIAAGVPWLQPFTVEGNTQQPIDTKQGRVLWLNYDQSHEDVIERFGALQREYKTGGENVFAISHSEPPAMLENERQARQLGRWIRAMQFIFVVVDSLIDVRGNRKLVEEEIGDVLRMWRIVAEESATPETGTEKGRPGAAVSLISHPTKGSDDLYGSTFIKAKLDHLYHVTRSGDIATIESEKQRTFGITEKLQARWGHWHFEGTRTLQTARFYGDNSQPESHPNSTTRDAVRDVLMTCPGRLMRLDDLHGIINADRKPEEYVSRDAVRKAADRLADSDKLISKEKPEHGDMGYVFGK